MDSQQGSKLKAVILAGGKGSRLSSITKDEIPKPMAVIDGIPVIGRIVQSLKENGIEDIYILLGHLYQKIEEYLGDGSSFGVNISYVVENQPLGSGGALYYLKDVIDCDFVICSGDTVFDIDISRMFSFHKSKNALFTLYTHPNFHPYDSDIVFTDKTDCVIEIDKKGSERNFYYNNNVNAGFVIADKSVLNYFTCAQKTNLEHDFIAHFIPQNKVFAYRCSEYIKDIGTPSRFAAAECDIKNGKVKSRNLKNLQKAIFLDRDGTINKYKGFISKADDIELIDGVAEAVKKINQSEYLAIIVSNQPIIARGDATFSEVENMFKKIETLLGSDGAYIDGYYYCPHHPDKGFEGEVAALKIMCGCRKPEIGLIKQAAAKFNLDLSRCYFIGDGDIDIQTARNAGIPSIRVKTGTPSGVLTPNCEAEDLPQAVEIILNKEI